MVEHADIAEIAAWLKLQDENSLTSRVDRLSHWMKTFQRVPKDIMVPFQGPLSLECYEGARLAYLEGSYVATVVLCVAHIEHELACCLVGLGKKRVAKAKLQVLLEEARQDGILSDSMVDALNNLREIRNSYAHFKPEYHLLSLSSRRVNPNESHRETMKADAERATEALASFFQERYEREQWT